MINRKIILDTETTGMNASGCFYENHKIIEIGAVEMINNNFTGYNFHSYIRPNRSIDKKAFKIHGISNDQLLNQPIFENISEEFLTYVKNATLVVHNAKFDISFLDYELSLLHDSSTKMSDYCNIIDTLSLARRLFPGKKNSLNALCNRYKINLNDRKTHSAIIDAKLLGKIYIFMINSQQSFLFNDHNSINNVVNNKKCVNILNNTNKFKVLFSTSYELKKHEELLIYMKKNYGKCLWKGINNK